MEDIQLITVDQLGRLGVDKFGHLYWDGAQVQTVLSLPFWVNLAVGCGALAAILNFLWNVGWAVYQRRHPAPKN